VDRSGILVEGVTQRSTIWETDIRLDQSKKKKQAVTFLVLVGDKKRGWAEQFTIAGRSWKGRRNT